MPIRIVGLRYGILNRSTYIASNSMIFPFSSKVLKAMILEELLKKEFDTRKAFLQALGTQTMAELAMHLFSVSGED